MNLSVQENSGLYWVIGILITINLGLIGTGVVFVSAKADSTTVARVQNDVAELERRDRNYLVRAEVERMIETQAPFAQERAVIVNRLDSLEMAAGNNGADIRAILTTLAAIQAEVSGMRRDIGSISKKLDSILNNPRLASDLTTVEEF